MIQTFFPNRIFKAFLFDFDGTLADTMPVHLAGWNHALGVYGLTLSEAQHTKWAGKPNTEVLRLLSEENKKDLSYPEIMRLKEAYYLNSIGNVREIAPVMDIVRANHGTMPMAIVSGSHRKAVQMTLEKLNLTKYFDFLVCAEDYVKGKPAPDCFLQAAAQLSVDPKDCLVFEDGQLGIDAALAAGMPCLRISQDAKDRSHLLSVVD